MTSILKSRIGSHCHGTSLPESDEDIRIIYIPTLDHFFGLKGQLEWKETDCDTEHWSIKKFIPLLVKGNPSALNILFVNKKDLLFKDEWGQRLLDFRDAFLSKRIVTACVGYCISQIHKIQIGRGTKEGKRSAIIEKYGYDTKFVYHAIMITNISIELIKTGAYRPLRPSEEQAYLRQIRRGEVPIDDVYAKVKSNLETIKAIESISSLPKHPDEEKINTWLVGLLSDYFKG